MIVQGNGQETLVNPGDYINADLNGVISLPANFATSLISPKAMTN